MRKFQRKVYLILVVLCIFVTCLPSSSISAASHTDIDKSKSNEDCPAQHTLVKCTPKTADEAVEAMLKVAENYRGWYLGCFITEGHSLGDGAWCAAFITRVAENAGLLDVFSKNNNAYGMFCEMIQKYGAQGWYTELTPSTTYGDKMRSIATQMKTVDIQKGDLVFFKFTESATVSHVGLVIEASKESITFYDGNGGSNSTVWNRPVRKKTYYNYNTSSFKGQYHEIVGIIRPNYSGAKSVVEAGNGTPSHSSGSCLADHAFTTKVSTTSAEAITNITTVAEQYDTWYEDCFNKVGASGLNYYQYTMWYIRKLASDAGVAEVFSASNDMEGFYKDMVKNYGAKGFYLPGNCASGYDTSVFQGSTQITWAKKEIKAGDIIFVKDTEYNGTKELNFEHCYLVVSVSGNEMYVTDGGIHDGNGVVKARYNRKYTKLDTSDIWMASHLVAILRPNYAGISSGGAEIIASGRCGNNATWKFTADKVLTISGMGETDSALDANGKFIGAAWKTYSSKIERLVISEGITGIGSASFRGCTTLKKVSLPTTLNEISGFAFYGCKSLSSIRVPAGIKALNESAFANCTTLCSVTGLQGVERIADKCFYGCNELANITLPSNVKAVEKGTFGNCNSTKLMIYGTKGSYAETYAKQYSIKFSTGLYADANGDGVLNKRDAEKVVSYLANFDFNTQKSSVSIGSEADTNRDGKVNLQDLLTISNLCK